MNDPVKLDVLSSCIKVAEMWKERTFNIKVTVYIFLVLRVLSRNFFRDNLICASVLYREKTKSPSILGPNSLFFTCRMIMGWITGCARLGDYVMYKLFDIIDYQVAVYACIKIPQDIV